MGLVFYHVQRLSSQEHGLSQNQSRRGPSLSQNQSVSHRGLNLSQNQSVDAGDEWFCHRVLQSIAVSGTGG